MLGCGYSFSSPLFCMCDLPYRSKSCTSFGFGRNLQSGVGIQYSIIVKSFGFSTLETTILGVPTGVAVRILVMPLRLAEGGLLSANRHHNPCLLHLSSVPCSSFKTVSLFRSDLLLEQPQLRHQCVLDPTNPVYALPDIPTV